MGGSSRSRSPKKQKTSKTTGSDKLAIEDDDVVVTKSEPSKQEVDKGKARALIAINKIKAMEPQEARRKAWRALLREWHPDKNLENHEVAFAVFQFLQKERSLVNL